MENLFKKNFCTIRYDNRTGILHAEWSGFLKLNEVMEGCYFMTEFIRKNGVVSHMSDHRNLRVLSTEVQNFLTQEWFPEAESFGLKRVGAVVSPDDTHCHFVCVESLILWVPATIGTVMVPHADWRTRPHGLLGR